MSQVICVVTHCVPGYLYCNPLCLRFSAFRPPVSQVLGIVTCVPGSLYYDAPMSWGYYFYPGLAQVLCTECCPHECRVFNISTTTVSLVFVFFVHLTTGTNTYEEEARLKKKKICVPFSELFLQHVVSTVLQQLIAK